MSPVTVLVVEHDAPAPELTAEALRWAEGLGATASLAGTGPLSEEVTRAWDAERRPVLVVWPCLPRLRPEHGEAALADLRAGCQVVLGPLMDGGLYLLGLSHPVPEVLAAATWAEGPEPAIALGMAAAGQLGLEVGLLRPERGLRTAQDVQAALVDPLTPDPIRRIFV